MTRREVVTVAVSTLQTQSTSTLLLLLLTLLALDITGSPASAPLVVAAGALPPLLFVRFVRVANRLLDERWIMMLSDVGALSVSLTLFLLVHSGNQQLWHVYLGMFLFSAFGAFYLPAMRGWVAGRTDDVEQLTWLNTMLAVVTQTAVVVGWALGGVMVASIGIESSLAICLFSYGFGVILQFVVFVVVNHAPMLREARKEHVPEASRSTAARVWRDVFSARRLGLFTMSFLTLGLTHTLAFSMFVPLLTGGDPDRSWIAGTANAGFALAAVASGLLVSGGLLGHYARSLAPYIIIAGFCVQILFGMSAEYSVLAICLYALVGLFSGGDSVLQSEVQDRWRSVGSAQAFAVFGAAQGPAQLVGALLVSLLLSWFPVHAVYMGTIVTLGWGAGLLLIVARSRSGAPSLNSQENI